MSRKCWDCNHSIPDDTKFCPNCRYSVKKMDEILARELIVKQAAKENKCWKCGHKLLDYSANFCHYCGNNITPIKHLREEKDKQKRERAQDEIKREENLLEYPFNLIIPILVISFFVFLIIFGILSK